MDETREKLIRERYYYHKGGLFARTSFNRVQAGEEVGVIDKRGYKRISVLGKKLLVHRVIYFLFYDVWPKELDHKNEDKSDNRIKNLRPCSRSQNKINVTKEGKGVRLHKSGRWEAYIHLDKKFKSLGYYNTRDDATKRRQQFEAGAFPEFSVFERNK